MTDFMKIFRHLKKNPAFSSIWVQFAIVPCIGSVSYNKAVTEVKSKKLVQQGEKLDQPGDQTGFKQAHLLI